MRINYASDSLHSKPAFADIKNNSTIVFAQFYVAEWRWLAQMMAALSIFGRISMFIMRRRLAYLSHVSRRRVRSNQ